MIRALQVMLAEMGEAACYYLALCWFAVERGRVISVAEDFAACVKTGWIRYNWDDPKWADNCFVSYPDAVLGYLLNEPGQWVVEKRPPEGPFPEGALLVGRYDWVTTRGTFSHFVPLKADLTPAWDSMGESNTVRNGTLQSVRVFTKRP